jgi:hypothetical protein
VTLGLQGSTRLAANKLLLVAFACLQLYLTEGEAA